MATKEAFFTKGSWDFDDLTRDFKHVIDYIDAEKEIMNAHMVDYFTMNHWETLLSPKLREELEALSSQQLTSLPSLDDLDCDGAEPLGVELNNFISKAKKAQLKSFPWVKDRKDFSSESKLDFISHIMTPKKSYEVEVMSDVINGLAQSFGVNKILDLGSGKGYLSQYLAMQYRLKVIGIDSSDSNTQNAAKRNDRLLKAWKGLSKKSSKEKVDAHRTAPGVHVLFSPSSQPLEPASTQENAKEKDDSHLPQKLSHCLSQVCKHCNSDVDAHGLKKTCSGCSDQLSFTCPCKPEQENSTSEENQATLLSGSAFDSIRTTCNPCEMEQEVFPHICDPFCRCSANWSSVHVQEGVNSTTAHSSLPCASRTGPNFNNVPSDGGVMVGESCHQYSKVPETTGKTMMMPKNQQIQAPNLNSFLPVTGFVNQSFVTSGELTRLFKELNSCDSAIDESNGLFLVGLHTCGNLAPMALRICAREPCVKLLCVVGCCYHTVTQEFRPDNTTGDPGFPMSEFFRQFKPQLSRNATMVAQQAADRIASEAKLPPPSVLYRAILQVILREKFHMDGRGMHVGKIGAKCKDFKEYVHKACNKLGLKEDELSVGEVESYLERFKSKEKQLHAFHQLRATIAPCIESVFLLDRLCYLYEQNIKSACIVKLFDAVKSPRCYAIIASKS